MSEEVVYIPRVVQYDNDEPLGVEGTVVGILNSNPSSRRATILVAEPAENHGDVEEAPEGVTIKESAVNLGELGYRELQELAKEKDLDIKLNQSTEDLRAAIEESL